MPSLTIVPRCLCVLLLPWIALPLGAAPELPPVGFDALLGFDRLPLLVDWPAYQDSSFHRDDINQDAGNFLRVEENGDQVLTDTAGPGVVYRIWSTGVVGTQMGKDCGLRFYFDGEATPRLDLTMAELFGATGSRWPFGSTSNRSTGFSILTTRTLHRRRDTNPPCS